MSSAATYESDGPKCPHCGRQFVADESFYFDEGRFTEMECDEEGCGKTFDVEVIHQVHWRGSAREPAPLPPTSPPPHSEAQPSAGNLPPDSKTEGEP